MTSLYLNFNGFFNISKIGYKENNVVHSWPPHADTDNLIHVNLFTLIQFSNCTNSQQTGSNP